MELGDGGGDKPGEGGEKRDIRRPMNAFLIFCKRHRSMVREKHPDRDNRSVTRILGDLWANLPNEEKSVYTNLAKQYKDAFMKANPDYKWHNTTERPSQPAKMATRPTNVRPPRIASPTDISLHGQSADKVGGLNLLLMAGQQSLPTRDKQGNVSHILERRMTCPDLSGSNSNSALLQLAEMCSSELTNRQNDASPLRHTPPKKRARHWSCNDMDSTVDNDESKKLSPTLPFHTITNPCFTHNPRPLPSATQTSQSEDGLQTLDQANNSCPVLPKKEKVDHYSQKTKMKMIDLTSKANCDTKHLMPSIPEDEKLEFTQSSRVTPNLTLQPVKRVNNSDVGIPPKKKFTKLQDRYSSDRKPLTVTPTTPMATLTQPMTTLSPPLATPIAPTATPTPATGTGCLSDQNDNAIFTCGKLVVEHIIDRLFSVSGGNSEHAQPLGNPSSTDIEKVRKIITANMTDRERSQAASSKDMGRLVSEVVQKPQNLVEKVIEEAYNLDFKGITKLEPTANSTELVSKSLLSEKAESDKSKPIIVVKPAVTENQFGISKLEPIQEQCGSEECGLSSIKQEEVIADKAPSDTASVVSAAGVSSDEAADPQPETPVGVTRAKEERYTDDMHVDSTKDDGGDYMQDDDDCYSQPVRKSRRRNRGQRYQELINEGIIQPSKERLAARRHEQVPSSASISVYSMDDLKDEDGTTDKQRMGLKRSISESEAGSGADDKRYRTGDFDLEAEIATLPPCSLDQVPRRRGPRKRSDSENGRRPNPGSPTQGREDSAGPRSPLSGVVSSSQSTGGTEPLTGSQKRKARKHSINRLVASSDTGSSAKPPGIEASIPMVRDATVSPVKTSHQQPTPPISQYSTASVATMAKSAACPDSTGDHSGWKPSRQAQRDQETTSMAIENGLTAGKSSAVVGIGGQKVLTAVEMCESRIGGPSVVPDSRTVCSDSRTCNSTGRLDKVGDCESTAAAKPILPEMTDWIKAGGEYRDVNPTADHGENTHTEASVVVNQRGSVVEVSGGDKLYAVDGVHCKSTSADRTEECSSRTLQVGVCSEMLLQQEPSRPPVSSTDRLEVSADNAHIYSSSAGVHNVGKKSMKFQQNKGKLSTDSALGSSIDHLEYMDKDSDMSHTEIATNPKVFLSETSGLLCTEILETMDHAKTEFLTSETTDCVSSAAPKKRKLDSVFDGSEDEVLLKPGFAPISRTGEDQAVLMSPVDAPVCSETSTSPDNVIVTVSASDAVGQFNVSSELTAGPRVTTVTVSTSEDMPTAIMMEEGALDPGLGKSLLCGSPLSS